jgi:hypothetical protein
MHPRPLPVLCAGAHDIAALHSLQSLKLAIILFRRLRDSPDLSRATANSQWMSQPTIAPRQARSVAGRADTNR